MVLLLEPIETSETDERARKLRKEREDLDKKLLSIKYVFPFSDSRNSSIIAGSCNSSFVNAL